MFEIRPSYIIFTQIDYINSILILSLHANSNVILFRFIWIDTYTLFYSKFHFYMCSQRKRNRRKRRIYRLIFYITKEIHFFISILFQFVVDHTLQRRLPARLDYDALPSLTTTKQSLHSYTKLRLIGF